MNNKKIPTTKIYATTGSLILQFALTILWGAVGVGALFLNEVLAFCPSLVLALIHAIKFNQLIRLREVCVDMLLNKEVAIFEIKYDDISFTLRSEYIDEEPPTAITGDGNIVICGEGNVCTSGKENNG